MASSFYQYSNFTLDSEESSLQDGTMEHLMNQKPVLRPWKLHQTESPEINDLDSTNFSQANIEAPFSSKGYS